MLKITAAVFLAISLYGCGGGGSTQPSQQPIKEALDNIVDKLPPAPKAFTGAYVLVNGAAIGYVEGKDKYDVVAYVASRIMDTPTGANAEAYRLMLSEVGLKVVVVGEAVGKSSITGLTLYASDTVFVVTLRTDGLHIVQAG